MKKGNTGIIILIVAVLVIGGFIIAGSASKRQTNPTPQQSQTGGSEQQTSENKTLGSDEFSTRFLSYSEANYKKATANNGKAVIFFHASWCPVCSEAEADLKTNWEKVPQDVTILKTDYDTAEQLKTRYGVVSQDTWVQVDAKGNEIGKWNSGGQGLSTLLANLK